MVRMTAVWAARGPGGSGRLRSFSWSCRGHRLGLGLAHAAQSGWKSGAARERVVTSRVHGMEGSEGSKTGSREPGLRGVR